MSESAPASPAPPFRREAIEYHASSRQKAHILRLTPAWTRWTYWLLLLVCGFAAIHVSMGRVDEYASGPAIVRADGRVDINARVTAVVEAVQARPGDRVRAGQILVRFYAAEIASELLRIDNEIEAQEIKVLQDLGDNGARHSLSSLRAAREQALARIEEHVVRAPRAGTVSDIRIEVGQRIAPGDFLLSLFGEAESFRVLAMLPGAYRPLLRPGMILRLELQGYAYAYQTVAIEAVASEVVGPSEARRYIGKSAAEVIAPQGAVVLVEARLPTGSFVSQGRGLSYYDGMQATAEVRVDSERMLLALVPGLKALFGE